MTAVAFLGLGVMGGPMAGHLVAAGHAVTVWNRTLAKAEGFIARHPGARRAESPAEAVHGAQIVCLCLGDDPDVRTVYAAFADALAEGAVVVDHTTASPALARELSADAAARGAGFLDAPVSGGEAGAIAGKLTIMVGGEAGHLARATPVLKPYAKAITHVGPAGAGQLTKAVNQLCIAGVLQGLAEGVHFAQAAGLDIERVLAAIGQGAAQSWQMDNRTRTMAEGKFDFGFAVDWMRKDLRIALEEGRALGAQLPLAALVDQFYADVQAKGGGRWDTSSLVTRLQCRVG